MVVGGLGPLLALALIFTLGGSALAAGPPPQPASHQFVGSVTIGETLAEPGTVVTAKIDGVADEWTTTVDVNGNYGNSEASDGTGLFFVSADDLDTPGVREGGAEGDTVEFWVLGKLAGEAPFERDGFTELPLTVTIPDTTAPTVEITIADPVNLANVSSVSVNITSNEDGTYIYYIISDGVIELSDTDAITADEPVELSLNLSTLADGTIIANASVEDADGNVGEAPPASATKDTTPPTVESTTPAASANVTIEVVVSATFDEDIDEATLVFTLGSVVGAQSYDSSTKTATFTPDANLDYDITYIASVEASDLAGNAMAEAHTWSFTTVVNNPPTASEPSPADQATNVSTSPELSVLASDLDEDLMAVTFYNASDDSVIDTVEGSANGTRPSVTWAGLDYGLQYSWYVKVSDAINEVTSDTWSFTTRAEGPVSFYSPPLSEGWNLLSTPIKLHSANNTLEQILGEPPASIVEASYRWDAVNEQWKSLIGYELSPLEAVYVKVAPGASVTAEFISSEELSWPPSRELQRGLNLIGPAPAFVDGDFEVMPLDQALISIAEPEVGLTGYIMVISPPHNQIPWAYALGGDIEDLVPYQGYWVVMQNAGTLLGFSSTPIQ